MKSNKLWEHLLLYMLVCKIKTKLLHLQKKNLPICQFLSVKSEPIQELLYTWTEDWTIFFQILYC